jgi:toxin ParE1/3/4
MKRLVFATAALADLDDIARFTEAQWGKQQKKKYLAKLNAALKRVRRNPERGRKRPEIDATLCSLLAGRHVIFYRILAEECRIVRIIHDRMDIHNHLAEPPAERS